MKKALVLLSLLALGTLPGCCWDCKKKDSDKKAHTLKNGHDAKKKAGAAANRYKK